jgi:hypothetical protein
MAVSYPSGVKRPDIPWLVWQKTRWERHGKLKLIERLALNRRKRRRQYRRALDQNRLIGWKS